MYNLKLTNVSTVFSFARLCNSIKYFAILFYTSIRYFAMLFYNAIKYFAILSYNIIKYFATRVILYQPQIWSELPGVRLVHEPISNYNREYLALLSTLEITIKCSNRVSNCHVTSTHCHVTSSHCHVMSSHGHVTSSHCHITSFNCHLAVF